MNTLIKHLYAFAILVWVIVLGSKFMSYMNMEIHKDIELIVCILLYLHILNLINIRDLKHKIELNNKENRQC